MVKHVCYRFKIITRYYITVIKVLTHINVTFKIFLFSLSLLYFFIFRARINRTTEKSNRMLYRCDVITGIHTHTHIYIYNIYVTQRTWRYFINPFKTGNTLLRIWRFCNINHYAYSADISPIVSSDSEASASSVHRWQLSTDSKYTQSHTDVLPVAKNGIKVFHEKYFSIIPLLTLVLPRHIKIYQSLAFASRWSVWKLSHDIHRPHPASHCNKRRAGCFIFWKWLFIKKVYLM